MRYPEVIRRILKGHPRTRRGIAAPLFIVGSGRSGNTLLRAMLVAGGSVDIPPETYVLGKVIRQWPLTGRLSWSAAVDRVYGTFEEHPEFVRLGIDIGVLREARRRSEPSRRTLADLLDALYRFHASSATPGVERWGDKTPLNTFHLKPIRSVFPEAKFVHMIRDGRDVAMSYVRMGRYGGMSSAAIRWRRSVRAARKFGASYPDQYFEVRYEDMIDSPESVLRGVCRFVGLDFTDTMLTRDRGSLVLGDVGALSHHERVMRPLDGRSVGRWKKGLDQRSVRRLERLLGPALHELGYKD